MEGTRKPPWSDLPSELLSMIGSRLHTRMDVLRFRSVCSSFRSSIAPLRRDDRRFPFRIPCSTGPNPFLHESTVYTVETPEGEPWLLNLQESKLGYKRILSLFSRRPIGTLPETLPKVLDCHQSRIVEICREYTLEYGSKTGEGTQKVVVRPDCAWTDQDHCLVYFIDGQGQLCYWKCGDENWSHLGSGYHDIVDYEGKVCVVDKLGSVSQIDSSFRLQSLSPPINCRCCEDRDQQKHLVVSKGDLYLVNQCITDVRRSYFGVYRLDRQRRVWEKVKRLGKSAFFICDGRSFEVSACELGRFEGDCIYYVEKDSPGSSSSGEGEVVKAFNLVDFNLEKVQFSGSLWLVKKGN